MLRSAPPFGQWACVELVLVDRQEEWRCALQSRGGDFVDPAAPESPETGARLTRPCAPDRVNARPMFRFQGSPCMALEPSQRGL